MRGRFSLTRKQFFAGGGQYWFFNHRCLQLFLITNALHESNVFGDKAATAADYDSDDNDDNDYNDCTVYFVFRNPEMKDSISFL